MAQRQPEHQRTDHERLVQEVVAQAVAPQPGQPAKPGEQPPGKVDAAGVTAPPDGLYFIQAHYPEHFDLPKVPLGPHWLNMPE